MKRTPFLRRPITHNFKQPHSKAEEPDRPFRWNLPSIMITTQSPRGRGEMGAGMSYNKLPTRTIVN